MSKMPRKTTPATARKAAAKKSAKPTSKRAPVRAVDDPSARIAVALEAIAAHLAANAPAPQEPFSFAEADAFVWHPNGRLSTVPRVSRVELTLVPPWDLA